MARVMITNNYILFLEDDLDFNRHIRHNLHNWGPVKNKTVTLASLYNPRVRELACDLRNNARIVEPHSVFGSQAFLISRPTVEYLLRHWKKVDGMQDIKISRLAGLLRNPIFYHAPSLVQHIGVQSGVEAFTRPWISIRVGPLSRRNSAAAFSH